MAKGYLKIVYRNQCEGCFSFKVLLPGEKIPITVWSEDIITEGDNIRFQDTGRDYLVTREERISSDQEDTMFVLIALE